MQRTITLDQDRALNALDYLLDTVEWTVDPEPAQDIAYLRAILSGQQVLVDIHDPETATIEVMP